MDSLPGLALALAGGGLIFRGVSGFCGTYYLLGIDTSCQAQPHAEASHEQPHLSEMVAEDEVEEASDESFPASDPPAWTATAASPSTKRRPR
jgi:hypothetical protein